MKIFETAVYLRVSGYRRWFMGGTGGGSVPEGVRYGPCYLPLNVSLLPGDQTFII